MMNNTELEKILADSLTDFKLDQQERFILKELSGTLRDEQLNFMRNTAFDLTRAFSEAGGEHAIRALNWLERVIKAIYSQNLKPLIPSRAYFSPGQDCRNEITRLIKQASRNIEICVFTISDNRITQAIVEAFERGVNVTIISDNDKTNDKGSDVDRLSEKGITVLLDKSSYHMHHKFAIFDQQILLSGSFNWTRSASEVNEENILVTSEKTLVLAFSDKFEHLKVKFKV